MGKVIFWIMRRWCSVVGHQWFTGPSSGDTWCGRCCADWAEQRQGPARDE